MWVMMPRETVRAIRHRLATQDMWLWRKGSLVHAKIHAWLWQRGNGNGEDPEAWPMRRENNE